jgi:hypothetical protein
MASRVLEYRSLLPEKGECRCWYCDKLIAINKIPVEGMEDQFELLLFSGFACKSCQAEVKGQPYKKDRRYENWLARRHETLAKQIDFKYPQIKVEIIYYQKEENGG